MKPMYHTRIITVMIVTLIALVSIYAAGNTESHEIQEIQEEKGMSKDFENTLSIQAAGRQSETRTQRPGGVRHTEQRNRLCIHRRIH